MFFVVAVLCTASALAGTAHALDETHSLSPSYHAAILASESKRTYTFHSPGITYDVFLGRRFGFRGRASIFFPTQLFEDGRFFHAREYYSFALGGEVLLGAAYTARLSDDELVIVDIGPHLNGLKLGSDVYESLYSLTFGVGASAEYFYPVGNHLSIGVFLGVALHFLDFIHDTNGLKLGGFVATGITVGYRSLKKKRPGP